MESALQRLRDLLLARAQIKFFRNNQAGCSFAAFAARDPKRFGWTHRVVGIDRKEIDSAIAEATSNPTISTLSLILRDCVDKPQLLSLINTLQECEYVSLGQDVTEDGFRCLGFRATIGPFESWLSGFGPFPYFPKTRQSPNTELAMRVKPRPPYKKVMKVAPEGVIHLADLDMLGMSERDFKALWQSSFTRTQSILGHKPDLRSAAKTTFALPVELVG